MLLQTVREATFMRLHVLHKGHTVSERKIKSRINVNCFNCKRLVHLCGCNFSQAPVSLFLFRKGWFWQFMFLATPFPLCGDPQNHENV